MPKSKAQKSSKLPPTFKRSRAANKKEHHQRFLQLVKAHREQARMAAKVVSLAGWIPEKIPDSVLREMRAAVERATKSQPRKKTRLAR